MVKFMMPVINLCDHVQPCACAVRLPAKQNLICYGPAAHSSLLPFIFSQTLAHLSMNHAGVPEHRISAADAAAG